LHDTPPEGTQSFFTERTTSLLSLHTVSPRASLTLTTTQPSLHLAISNPQQGDPRHPQTQPRNPANFSRTYTATTSNRHTPKPHSQRGYPQPRSSPLSHHTQPLGGSAPKKVGIHKSSPSKKEGPSFSDQIHQRTQTKHRQGSNKIHQKRIIIIGEGWFIIQSKSSKNRNKNQTYSGKKTES